jgi:hypothetical protein
MSLVLSVMILAVCVTLHHNSTNTNTKAGVITARVIYSFF